jgi:CRISPR/Cas system CSM-associated protein Csm3 (group 7 of RAMP superfamily)
MIEWSYVLSFRSSVSVFSGMAVAGLVDRMVMRCQGGIPYIPGSSVKGRWRFFAERLLRSGGLPADFRIHGDNEPLCKEWNDACILCKFFGNPDLPARLWVSQAEIERHSNQVIRGLLARNPNPVVHPDAEQRPGIALSRVFRTAPEDHLFFDEALPPLTFTGVVRFNKEPTSNEETFLKASARLIDRIGGRKAVGRGILHEGIRFEANDGDKGPKGGDA